MSGEEIYPPSYDQLFEGYIGLAALRGTVSYEPDSLDPESGDDGTLTPTGERALTRTYEIEEENLPEAIRNTGIDGVKIQFDSSRVYKNHVRPEAITISLHDTGGVTRSFEFERESEIITATGVTISGDYLEPREEVGQGLSTEEKNSIVDDVYNGDTYWLEQSGPAGEFARSVYFTLLFRSQTRKPDATEIMTLYEILSALSPEETE